MSRTKIERRYRKMQADAKAFGAELLTEESIFIDDDHLDCVWYGGHIGGLRYKGYEVSVEVHGDVEITGFMNGRDFLYKNKQNTGAMNMAASDTLRTTFKSDSELWDALNADEEAENILIQPVRHSKGPLQVPDTLRIQCPGKDGGFRRRKCLCAFRQFL